MYKIKWHEEGVERSQEFDKPVYRELFQDLVNKGYAPVVISVSDNGDESELDTSVEFSNALLKNIGAIQ